MRSISPFLLMLVLPLAAHGGDWPFWRHDAQRSNASPDELPSEMRLHWVRALPRPTPAWPDQPSMQFDAAYEPVVAGRRLFVGSSHDGTVAAFDTRTGRELWTFSADGPVRFAPLVWQEKLYFVSDDGCLYCLRASDGALQWRFRGGPSDRRILGNGRMISMWPARGAPVLEDGTIYFAAGIWPFMGIFLHALDATTGDVVWSNDGDGSRYMKQPHNSDSFAGVAPQGPLVAIGEKLLIPGGRSVPACYDRNTGRMLYYQLAENGKKGGGSTVVAAGTMFVNGPALFDLETEKYLGPAGELNVVADGILYDSRSKDLRTFDLATAGVEVTETVDRKGETTKSLKWTIRELGKAETPKLTALIKAGDRLYAGSDRRLIAMPLALPDKAKADIAWDAAIEGTPLSLVAADDRLFAVTREGSLYCFGESGTGPAALRPLQHPLPAAPLQKSDSASARVRAILDATDVREGCCLVWGAGDGGLATELIRQSRLQIVVIESDPEKSNALRRRLRAVGIGGDRCAVIVADPLKLALPQYFASLIVTEIMPPDEARDAWLTNTFACLRPFGSAAWLPVAPDHIDELSASAERPSIVGATWKPAGDATLLVREGPLPSSADWTHEHADAANTRVSKDQIVKAPLGLLWFGGSSNEPILPRHGHGPQPQVVAGRLFIEGIDLIRAMDIYTGRVLWESKLPGVGMLYDNTSHQPGANASGTNYVATPEGVYVAWRDACVRLDPATGKKTAEFRLPPLPGSQKSPLWGYLNIAGNYLIGGADPLFDPTLLKAPKKLPPAATSDGDSDKKPDSPPAVAETPLDRIFKIENDNYSSSGRLVVMDRATGNPLWTATARSGFRHNAVCIGGGRLYCIDRLSGAQLSRLKRRGEEPPHPPRLVAFDLATGEEVWSAEADVFGTWLSYSAERDVLVEAGRTAKDTLSDEPKGMRAYRASNGEVLWASKTLTGPAMLHHDTILMQGSACNLVTGKPTMRDHPLSGEPVEWVWSRNYGCNTPAASEHLLTFRSGAAGYFDLCGDGGTGNFGGFRSSCTNNLIVAGGLLNAPDYTRTCTCTYQNQASLALVPMPDAEMWTSFGAQTPKQSVRTLGLNLGAPGDRRAGDGTLWLEYPSVGGASPTVPVRIEPEKPVWFRRHSAQVEGPGLAWVASSGARGLRSIRITLSATDDFARRYTVRLHFAEPDDAQPGERVFAVRLQERTVLPALDVVKEAEGRHRSLVKEFTGVLVEDDLVIELVPDEDAKRPETVLSGIEIHAEGW